MYYCDSGLNLSLSQNNYLICTELVLNCHPLSIRAGLRLGVLLGLIRID